MSNSELLPAEIVDEQLEEKVLRLRLQGLTTTQISRKTMLAPHQVHAALDLILPKLDQFYRRRMIAESLVICDKVIGQHMSTMADPESASVVIRGLCERRFWLGINAHVDPVQLTQATKPESSLAAIEEALAHCAAQGSEPAEPGS